MSQKQQICLMMVYSTLNAKKYNGLFLCFLLYVTLFLLSSVKAQDKTTILEKSDNIHISQEGLTDWNLIPAGGGGDWQTAIGRAQDLNRPQSTGNPLLPQPQHFFGSWFGVRTWLYDHGINLNVDNINEFAGNITGGRRRGATNAGSVDANLDIDWETLAGKNWVTGGLVSHMTVINRYGNNLAKSVGETITKFQEIYGAGGNVVAKLVNLYVDKYLWNKKIVVSFGRMNVGGFYARSPIQCNFINNGICGTPRPLTGQAGGFNTYPDSTWGITALYRPLPQLYFRVGLYQVSRAVYTNFAGKRAGWAAIVTNNMDAGAEIPLEVGYETHFGKNDLVGHYKVGFAYDTSAYPIWGRGIDGSRLTKLNGSNQKWKRGRDQEWIIGDQMFYRNGPGELNGLIGYLGFIHTNPKTFQRKNQIIVGFINTGFWKARPMDGIGILFIHQTMSKTLRNAQKYSLSQGVPMDSLIGSASGVQRAEQTFELTYIIHVAQGVRFQPDFQYEIHPNAQKNIPNAAFLGFRSRVDF